jgi:hypothetical protein
MRRLVPGFGGDKGFDFMLSTIPEKHDLDQQVAFHRTSVAGSLIGTIADTQDVLDLCAELGSPPPGFTRRRLRHVRLSMV